MNEIVTPNELAKELGITGLAFRNWLRAIAASGHPIVERHGKRERYRFSPIEGDQLLGEYRDQHATSRSRWVHSASTPPHPRATRAASAGQSVSGGHGVEVDWMGCSVSTLEDLLCPGLLGVVVGINPAPVSVAAGHYWQGNTGRTLWRRLVAVGLMPADIDGYHDDVAFAAGLGFTDVVKRPTPSARYLDSAELEFGRVALESKLEEFSVPLVIFAFKQAATTLFGPISGNGFVQGPRLGRSEIFVMPGPYEATASADRTLAQLRDWLESRRP